MYKAALVTVAVGVLWCLGSPAHASDADLVFQCGSLGQGANFVTGNCAPSAQPTQQWPQVERVVVERRVVVVHVHDTVDASDLDPDAVDQYLSDDGDDE